MFKKNKDILNIALPAMGENFLQMLMGMVDSYLVAHLGLIAISGVSVAGNIITIYQAIFIALGAAISSVISKSLGQKDQSMLAYHVTEALKITLLFSCSAWLAVLTVSLLGHFPAWQLQASHYECEYSQYSNVPAASG